MRFTTRLRRTAVGMLGVASLTLMGLQAPATAAVVSGDGPVCVEPGHENHGDASASARGGHGGNDTRPVSAKEQRQIRARTDRLLDRRPPSEAPTDVTVPVYVHVMAAEDGSGDVSRTAINRQIDVLNKTFGGGESSTAANTSFTFTLAGVDRFYNDTWHADHSSTTYRKATRQGGANALNMWLVNFKWLGIATFPWDYSKSPAIDGVRVHYASLPGGEIENYNLGETATHEVGHWLGLYHTFQGGCTELNDEVADTPAQSSPTNGCPEGRDSCELPGLDPIHNYMDYSYDSCYTEFTSGQSTRMTDMWAAYRA